MAKRTKKITSNAAQNEIAAAALRLIEPPAHIDLNKIEKIFFDNIIDEMAVADWSDHQIEIAALLAGNMAAAHNARKKLRDEKKASEQHAYLKIITQLQGLIYAGRRSLGLHARGQGGDARDIGKRKKMAKEVEEKVRATFDDDDELLARPMN